MDNSTETPLANAIFQLQNRNGDAIKVVKTAANTYRRAMTDSEENAVDTITTDGTGEFVINGLASGNYQLAEIAAPDGYNKLSAPVSFVIDQNGTVTSSGSPVEKVKILNQAGSLLPDTGGIGTTIFYVVGSSVIAVALVLLVVRKRRQSKVAD